MSTYSEKTTFYAYAAEDGTLLTALFESQGAATSDLYSHFERQVTDVKWEDFKAGRSYSDSYRQYRKAVRKAARELAQGKGKLVTFKLVRNG